MAVGRSFGPKWEGRRSRLPRVSQLWVKNLVSTRHHRADIVIVRRQGPDWRKGSTMNSTATCLTWREKGFFRLHFVRYSPCDDNKQPYQSGLVVARVNEDRAFRRTPGRRCQVCTGASSKIRGRDNITIVIWNTKALRAARKLQELTHEMSRYRWNILGLCEMRWKNFAETTTEEGRKVFFSGKKKE